MSDLTAIDLIIMIAKDSPCLYDKSYECRTNIKSERKKVYQTMVEAIELNCCEETNEEEVEAVWLKLVKKFKSELTNFLRHVPSGSGATASYQFDWPEFKSLMFLEPYVDHRENISSVNFDNTFNKKENSKFNKRSKKFNTQDIVDAKLKKIADNIPVISEKDNDYKSYLQLIKTGLEGVQEKKKFECVAEILSYIEKYHMQLQLYK